MLLWSCVLQNCNRPDVSTRTRNFNGSNVVELSSMSQLVLLVSGAQGQNGHRPFNLCFNVSGPSKRPTSEYFKKHTFTSYSSLDLLKISGKKSCLKKYDGFCMFLQLDNKNNTFNTRVVAHQLNSSPRGAFTVPLAPRKRSSKKSFRACVTKQLRADCACLERCFFFVFWIDHNISFLLDPFFLKTMILSFDHNISEPHTIQTGWDWY